MGPPSSTSEEGAMGKIAPIPQDWGQKDRQGLTGKTAQKKVIRGPAIESRNSGSGGPVSPEVPPRKVSPGAKRTH